MSGAAIVGTCTLLLLTVGCGRNPLGTRDGGAPEVRPAEILDAAKGARDRTSDPPGWVAADQGPESPSDVAERELGVKAERTSLEEIARPLSADREES